MSLPDELRTDLAALRSSYTYCKSYFYPHWYQGKVADVTKQFCTLLKKSIPQTPAQAKESCLAKEVRRFRKEFESVVVDSHQMKRLKRIEFAYLLAIPSKALKEPLNKGFLSFVQMTRIDCTMAIFDHKLEVDKEQAILLMKNGNYVRWTAAKSFALLLAKKSEASPSSLWVYGEHGLMCTKADLYQWTIPKPLKAGDPDKTPLWGKNNYLDICVHAKEPKLSGNHSWFRLRTKEGKIYVFSLMRHPNKFTLGPLRGEVISPDNSEWWVDYPHRDFQIKITDDQAKKVLQLQINKKKASPLRFQNFADNCTNDALNVLQQIGITPPECRVNVWRHILPLSLTDPVVNTLSPNVLSAIEGVSTIFTNIIALKFQPFSRDPHPNVGESYFTSFWDLFNREKTRMTSPYFLVQALSKDSRFEEITKETPKYLRASSAIETT